jgi:hypothetical protein
MSDKPEQMPESITNSTKKSQSKLLGLILALLLTPSSPALAQANDPFGGSDVKWPEPPGAFLNTKPQTKRTANPPPVSNSRSATGQGQATSQWVTPAGQQGNWSQQANSGQQAMPQEWQNELQQDEQNDSSGWQTQQSGFPQANSQSNGISSSGWITPQQNSQNPQPRQVRQVPTNSSQGASRQPQAGSGQIQWLSNGANNVSGNNPNYGNNWSQEAPQQQQSGWVQPGQPQHQPQSQWATSGQQQQAIGQSGWVQPGHPQQSNRNTGSDGAPLFGEVLKQEQAAQGNGAGIPGFTPALPGYQLGQGTGSIPGFNPSNGGASNIPGFTPATGGSTIQGFTPSNGMAELLQNIMPTAGNTIKLPNTRPMAAAQPMRRPAARSNSSIGGNINRTISRNVNRSINKMINKGFSSLRF